MTKSRDYRKEYDCYYGKKGQPGTWTAIQKLHRKHKTARNKAHRMMKPGKGIDIDHKDHNPLNNSRSNLRKMSVKRNRGKCAKKKC